MVEGARLESVYTATYRGFESLPLRHLDKNVSPPEAFLSRGRACGDDGGSPVKRLLVSIAAWLAFFNAVMVVNVPVFIVACSKCDMFESKSLYYRLTHGYFDLLAILPGQGLWLLLGLSPVTWILLYIWTGATGILPWRRPPRTGNDS